MSAELEEARALGELVKQGWRPKRTIVYAAWDGEEQGLLGSTEWVEQHEQELRDKAVVYINTDGNGRGFLNVGGSHALEAVRQRVARDVEDPETKAVGLEADAGARDRQHGPPRRAQRGARRGPICGSARSGRDPTTRRSSSTPASPALQSRVRRARSSDGDLSLDLRRLLPLHEVPRHRLRLRPRARADGRHGRRSGWPTPTCCRSSSRTSPTRSQTYVRELQALLKERQDDVRERNRQIEDGVFAGVADPRRPLKAPAVEDVPPALNFAPLENAPARSRGGRPLHESRSRPRGAKLTPDAARARQRAADPERAAADRRRPGCRGGPGIGICSTRPGSTRATP